jgi:hypothetical protein
MELVKEPEEATAPSHATTTSQPGVRMWGAVSAAVRYP